MRPLIPNKKKLSDFPNRQNFTKRLVGKRLRFSISLSPGLWGRKKWRICKNVLNPLLPFIELAAVYELQTDTPLFKKIAAYVKQKNNRHELDLAGRKWQVFLPILYKPRVFSTIHEIRGSILLACKNGAIPWNKIFRQASGPYIIDNASVGCGKAALQYAKQNENSNRVFVIIEKINSGLESLTIISEKNTILRIFEMAAQTCKLSRIYQFDIENSGDKTEQSVDKRIKGNPVEVKSMRKIKYEIIPGMGDGEITEENDLLHFVLEIPYLFNFNLIPPMAVMNDYFQSGLVDNGMNGGCRWAPFEIDKKEYDELAAALLLDLKEAYKTVSVPEWVQNKTDWHIWTSEYEIGIPSKKHYELWQENDQWEVMKKEAQAKGDEELAMKYHLKAIETAERLVKFIEPYIKKYHKKKNRC